MKSFLVPEQENNSRLDRCIRRILGNINQSLLEKYLRQRLILVNTKKAKASQKVKVGQLIYYAKSILFEKIKTENITDFSDSEVKFYKELYNKIVINETEGWITLNKPNNIAVQGGSKQKFHLDNFLKVNFHNMSQKPRLVHRLDKDTSGLLLIAKNQFAARSISRFFKEGKIIKIYYALVSPSPKDKFGIIKTRINKLKNLNINKMGISENQGKHSITKFNVLEKLNDDLALVALNPITGRTHQLRIHMQHIGSPIIGDKKYFNFVSEASKIDKDHLLKLHSGILKIPKEKMMIANLPKHFKDTLEYYGIKLMKPEKIYNYFLRDRIEK